MPLFPFSLIAVYMKITSLSVNKICLEHHHFSKTMSGSISTEYFQIDGYGSDRSASDIYYGVYTTYYQNYEEE